MTGCCVVGCHNSSYRGSRMCRLPRGETRRKAWVQQINRPNWIPGPSATICHEHFTESDWGISKTGKIRLKKIAIPTIFKRDVPTVVNNKETNNEITSNEPKVETGLKNKFIIILRKNVVEPLKRNVNYEGIMLDFKSNGIKVAAEEEKNLVAHRQSNNVSCIEKSSTEDSSNDSHQHCEEGDVIDSSTQQQHIKNQKSNKSRSMKKQVGCPARSNSVAGSHVNTNLVRYRETSESGNLMNALQDCLQEQQKLKRRLILEIKRHNDRLKKLSLAFQRTEKLRRKAYRELKEAKKKIKQLEKQVH